MKRVVVDNQYRAFAMTRYLLSWLVIPLLASQLGSCQSQTPSPVEGVYEFAHTDKDPERRVAYYREDPCIGLMQVGYHNFDPYWVANPEIPVDRSGELFGYFHQQLVARYDSERVSNGLPLTIPFDNFHAPIPEAYFPNFPQLSTKYTYYGRPENVKLQDYPGKYTVDEVIEMWDHLTEAVKKRYILHENGTKIPIYGNPNGLDLLGRISMSYAGAINHKYYGCYHSAIHIMFSKPMDTSSKYYKHTDIFIGFMLSAMDPIFYRTHKHMVNLFAYYKMQLPPYNINELGFPGIRLHDIYVIGDTTNKKNELTTFMQQWRPLMAHGMDMLTDQPIWMLLHILNHEEFTYQLQVENRGNRKVKATVRLLLAPIKTCDGQIIPLEVQRQLFIEMDKFKVELEPGMNDLSHHSTESWVTIPLERSTEILATSPKVIDATVVPRCVWPDDPVDQAAEAPPEMDLGQLLDQTTARKNCGWAHHLQIPKGNSSGVTFALFAMLTNWDHDKATSDHEQDFNDATAYCGAFKDKYPDKRAMGFPFDRPFGYGATLRNILLPNMGVSKVTIFHSEEVVPLGGAFTG